MNAIFSIDAAILLICMFVIFKWDFEFERPHSRTKFLDKSWLYPFCLLAISAASYRIYIDGFFLPWQVYCTCILFTCPDLILFHLFDKNISCQLRNCEKKEWGNNWKKVKKLSLFSTLVPELLILFSIQSWKEKQRIKQHSPSDFSDTDQKLHSSLQIAFGISILSSLIIENVFEYIFAISLAITAAYYTKAGKDKLKHDWAFRNKLIYLKKAAEHQLSWKVLPDDLVRLIQKGSFLVICVEIFSFLFLSMLNELLILRIWLMLLLGFHVMVLLASGINFWKWMLSLISIFLISLSVNSSSFSELHFFAYAVTFCYFFFISKRTPILAWLDSPISNLYRIEIFSKNDKWRKVNPYHFSPFDICFSQNRFGFFPFSSKTNVGCLGAVRDNQLYDQMVDVSENVSEEIKVKMVAELLEKNAKLVHRNDQRTLGIINWIVDIKSNHAGRTVVTQNLSKAFSHIRNGYSDTVNEKNIKDVEKIRITHTKKFWSENLKKFILLNEDQITLSLSKVTNEKD